MEIAIFVFLAIFIIALLFLPFIIYRMSDTLDRIYSCVDKIYKGLECKSDKPLK